MAETFGSTCHGAGRAASRNKSRRQLDYKEVLGRLQEQGIAIRVASPKLVMEEVWGRPRPCRKSIPSPVARVAAVRNALRDFLCLMAGA